MCASSRPSIRVEVGTSKLATRAFCTEVASLANHAYGYNRLSAPEVAQRLEMGDAGPDANRVLHLAWRAEDETGEETLVGICSSTRQTPWCPRGCGHWGLLAVKVAAQGTGVASALVRAAEHRLSLAGLQQVQIEYEYTRGDATSERLYAWYEGTLGFSGGGAPGRQEFRRCRKRLSMVADGEVASAFDVTANDKHSASKASCGASDTAGSASNVTTTVKQSTLRCWALLIRIYRRTLAVTMGVTW